MKFLIKLLLILALSLLLGLLMARPVTAKAPTKLNNEDYQSGNLIIKDNAIQFPQIILQEETVLRPVPKTTGSGFKTAIRTSENGEHTNRSVASYSGRHYSKDEVIQLIKDYSAQYGIPAEVPLCIAKLESGYNQFSKNKSSSASGVMQYLSGTWKGTDEGKAGLSVFDADSNIKAAIKYMASRRSTTPWEVRNNCPQL